jgi:threonine dehydratase
MPELSFLDVINSYNKIFPYIKETPLIINKNLNQLLNAEIFLKMDNQQITNSFKIRGAFNAILSYRDRFGNFPQKVVVQSSGNHAAAIAYICHKFGIESLIYMASSVPRIKIEAVKKLGANVVICEKRAEANFLASQKAKEGYFFIHPSDNDDVITGQATSTFEAINQIAKIENTDYNKVTIDAIFAPCGGGGLVAGCFLASLGLNNLVKIFGCEPLLANDAKNSLRNNKIFAFCDSPNTIADGARTLAIADRCFYYLKKINDILEISEEKIIFWQKHLSNELKQSIEPTSALAIAGVDQFMSINFDIFNSKGKKPRLLAIISGGNVEN